VFHKDTGGNNIFVSLVFDNQKTIEATEWFADLAQPSKKRMSWQSELLPPDLIKELDLSRDSLGLDPEHGEGTSVRGGVSKGVNTYVSWVDDLVWHATPVAEPRLDYTTGAARDSYKWLNEAATESEGFTYRSKQLKRTMYGVEILGSMAEAENTALSKWLVTNGLTAQDIDTTVAKRPGRTCTARVVGSEEALVGQFGIVPAQYPYPRSEERAFRAVVVLAGRLQFLTVQTVHPPTHGGVVPVVCSRLLSTAGHFAGVGEAAGGEVLVGPPEAM
jgi:hypothetical protein